MNRGPREGYGPHGRKELDTTKPVHSKGDQSWVFFGRTDAKAETPVLWPPHTKIWLMGKDPYAGRDWGQEEKGTTEDEMAVWHHKLDAHEFGWTLGVGDGQEAWRAAILGVAKCRIWLSDWTELNWTEKNCIYLERWVLLPGKSHGWRSLIGCSPWGH